MKGSPQSWRLLRNSTPQKEPRVTTATIATTCGIAAVNHIIYHLFYFTYTVHAKSLQSSPTLCNPMDHIPPGSSVHGILQARILEGLAMPSSKGSSDPGIKPASHVSCTGR